MIKIPAAGAISRLGIRFGERRKRENEGKRPALTEDDNRNIAEFTDLVHATIALLVRENALLETGDAPRVADLYREKTQLFRKLSLKQSLVEPFLKEDLPEISNLRDILRILTDHLTRNRQMLEGMAGASRNIISEIEHIKRRQSLEGVYDKKGQPKSGMTPKIERTLKKL